MDSFPYSKDNPPCIYSVYGGTTGASALNSIVLPFVKLPHAMTSSNGQPGIGAGMTLTKESIGEDS